MLAANSAPVIFQLAKEIGAELEEMDSHKLALIDSSTGAYRDNEVADDYVSLISLTLELQVNASSYWRIIKYRFWFQVLVTSFLFILCVLFSFCGIITDLTFRKIGHLLFMILSCNV